MLIGAKRSLLKAPAVVASSGWEAAINFRQTSGYVTDGAGETYCLEEAYPVSRGGLTFGWSAASQSIARNRNSGVDRRLAGIMFANSGAIRTFQLDLPATGSYDIYAAFGDYSFGQTNNVVLRDNGSTVQSYTGVTSAQQWQDASGVVRTSPTDWVNNNASLTHTFTSTVLELYCDGTSASAGFISHLRVVQN